VTQAFESAARFFSLEPAMAHSARLQVLTALAHCELQRGHTQRAVAWLRAVESESVTRQGYWGCVDWPLLPVYLQLALLAGYEPQLLHDVASAASGPEGESIDHLTAWSAALRETDPEASLRSLDLGLLSGPARQPLVTAHMKLTSALRQRELGFVEVARFNFTQASEEFQRFSAHGWSALATSHLDSSDVHASGSTLLGPGRPAPAAPSPGPQADQALPTEAQPPGGTDAHDNGLPPSYEIRLLGQFSVVCNGTPAPVPLGHAAQALKVVALFGRISVDELAEVLWPEAEPGVGTRRLRNILWRIKSSSGDVLRRNDNFICLEEGVVTDMAAFEEAATRAFKEDVSSDSAHRLAREAIALYGGELLPSDRYADWATGPREALVQLRLQLLDLMLAHASDSGNRQEALALLEDLIDADPYEERYYTQLASLHLDAGNRSRVRASIARCERMLEDLGVEPSRHFRTFVRELEDA
jgi:DNA-binding SARP family transcriptional activator